MSVLLTGVVFAGIVAAIAMIFLLMKLDIKKVCGYDVTVDVGFTFLLAWMLAGTFTGMLAALLGGAIISVFLYFMKKANGYKRLVIHNRKLQWREYHV